MVYQKPQINHDPLLEVEFYHQEMKNYLCFKDYKSNLFDPFAVYIIKVFI